MMRKNCVSWLIFLLFIFPFPPPVLSRQLVILRSIWNRKKWRIFCFWICCSKNSKHQQVSPFDVHFLLPFVGVVAKDFDPAEVRNVFTHEFYDYFGAFWLIAIWMKFLFSLSRFLFFMPSQWFTSSLHSWYAAHFFFYFYVCHPLLPPLAQDFPSWKEKVARFHYIEMSRLT